MRGDHAVEPTKARLEISVDFCCTGSPWVVTSGVTANKRKHDALKTVQISSEIHRKLVAYARTGGFKVKALVERAITQTYILK